MTLTDDASAANSVALATVGGDVVALSLEGRTGMTPVHAIRLQLSTGPPRLRKDVVIWVGASAQPLTEIAALGWGAGVWGLVAMEKDITQFGLARLHVDADPQMESEVTWRTYPNGVDPAPVAATEVCGVPSVVYAQPANAEPHCPQELHWAAISEQGLGTSAIVARASAFSRVSVTALEKGALLAYVADHRTWARLLPCAPRP
jgi:hypothetical protein